MAEYPYLPLFVSDYLGDTRHLTTEQGGDQLMILPDHVLEQAGKRANPRQRGRR